jgi:hypothetical protein
MKKKNLVSLSVAAIFLVLGTTGILLYLKQKPHYVEMTHTIFGLLFVTFAIFHIVNNWGSLRAYAKDRQAGGIRKELLLVSGVAVVMVTLAATEVLEPVAEFGRIFAKPAKKGPAGITFQEQHTLDSAAGRPVTLILQKQPDMIKARLTVSLTDATGQNAIDLYDSGEAGEGQPAHLMLHTRIAAEGAVRIVVRTAYEGSTGVSETTLDTLAAGAYSLTSGEGTGLTRGLLQLK